MKKETREQITRYGKELHLPMFRQHFEEHAKQAARRSLSYEDYLLGLMEVEYHNRMENRKKNYIRQAGFPQRHYLHELDKMALPSMAAEKLPELERLDFLQEGRNVVLAGNPGTGGRLPGRHILPPLWVSGHVKRPIRYSLLPCQDY